MSEHPVLPSALLSSSHAQFLEQLSDQDFWKHAAEVASALSTPAPQLEEYLECDCKTQKHRQTLRCMLSLSGLREIVSLPHRFAGLPDSPAWMLGVAAWRGEVIAVVDLAAYLTNGSAQSHAIGTMLVANKDDLTIGLFVATVGSTATFEMEQMVPPEQMSIGDTVTLCARVAGAVKGVYAETLVLDIPIILADIVEQLRVTASL